MKHDEKVFKLAGRSLQAAMELDTALIKEVIELKDLTSFFKRYRAQLKHIGRASQAVQVMAQDGAHPRAYALIPCCYIDPVVKSTYYIYSPVDYKGRCFVPEDAVQLGEDEARRIGDRLGGGGWAPAETLIPMPIVRGVQLPADFNAASDRTLYDEPKFDPKACTKFFNGIQNLKQHFCDGKFIRTYANPKDITLLTKFRSDENRRPLIVLSAYERQAMKRLPIESNSWLKATPLGNDEYLIIPDVKTAGGMVLRDTLNTIPDLPDPETLWTMQDAADRGNLILPPPPPRKFLHLNEKAPWPFPKSVPAP